MMNVYEAWQTGRTVRKHTMHVLRRENTAEHSWGVVLLVLRYAPYASAKFTAAAHMHDAGEGRTCDVPAHLCWEFPDLKNAIEAKECEAIAEALYQPGSPWDPINVFDLTSDEKLFLEVADRAEFVLGCLYDLHMGNRLVLVPLQRAYVKARDTSREITPGSDLSESALRLMQDIGGLVNKEKINGCE